MTTIYTHANYFRDDGNAWSGRWGFDKESACQGSGIGSSHDKSLYWLPQLESCSSEGGPVMAMTLVAGMTDPSLGALEEAYETNPADDTVD